MDNKDVMITFENLEEYDNNAKQRKIAYNQISDTYIDTVSSHNSLIRGKEIKLSWEELRDNIQAGNFSDIYIGDYKEITLTTGEEVVMEVAGIDLYWFPYRDNSATIDLINHHVDFISRDCLSGFRRMNATKTNNGTASVQNPWVASELYDTMNNENAGIYATLPSDLKSCIINKYTMAGCRYSAGGAISTDSSEAWTYLGKLWLPTEVELFGYTIYSTPRYGRGQGNRYPIYKLGENIRMAKGNGKNGLTIRWWTMSTVDGSTTNFCYVGGYGGIGQAIPTDTNKYGTPLCFRIG